MLVSHGRYDGRDEEGTACSRFPPVWRADFPPEFSRGGGICKEEGLLFGVMGKTFADNSAYPSRIFFPTISAL